MLIDVTALGAFYAGPLGVMARRLIGRRVRAFWPDVTGRTVMGLGYPVPYLGVFAGEAERVAALMPAAQGVACWPAEPPWRVALVDEYALPLPDASVDRLLMAHMLEMSPVPQTLLREAWRVLAPEGRLIAVVPNRRGLWARLDTTPFGHGRPYSRGQLDELLREAMFDPLNRTSALTLPPVGRGFLLRSAPALERFGGRVMPGFEGVLIVEAGKQVYAPVRVAGEVPVAARLRAARVLPAGHAAPGAAFLDPAAISLRQNESSKA